MELDDENLLIGILLIWGTFLCKAQTSHEPYTFFKEYVGLDDKQVSDIEHGKPVTKVLSTQTVRSRFSRLSTLMPPRSSTSRRRRMLTPCADPRTIWPFGSSARRRSYLISRVSF
jgi:hypothetical protein